MLRVTSRNVLVVPPLECAWLSIGDHLEGASSSAKGALLQFEVKGDNDATVIFKPVPGAKRWQPLARQAGDQGGAVVQAAAPAGIAAAPAGPAGQQLGLTVESNYTVILGSHRNSCLKFEKSGETKQSVRGVAGARLDPHTFTSYWINYRPGDITVGSGTPGPSTIAAHWVDGDAPIADIQHIGLSSWDSHVSYRGVRLMQPLDLPGPGAAQASTPNGAQADSSSNSSSSSGSVHVVPTLFELTSMCLVASLTPHNVCGVLAVAALLLPTTAELYRACLGFAAQRFREVLSVHGGALWDMSADVLADVLQESALAVPERTVFDVVALWSSCGIPWGSNADESDAMASSSGCGGMASSSAASGSAEALARGCRRPAQDVEHVLQCVRFVLMSEQELQEVRRHPCSRSHALVLQLIEQDLAAQASDAAARSLCLDKRRLVKPVDLRAGASGQQLRYQRRLAPACTELMYVCDGDRNGVLWYIGAEYGRRQWMNPVLARRVEVRASSPASRYTDPRVIASRQFARTSFAGPRYEGGQPSSWWLVDLGPQHRLLCNYYTMRHDASSDFARHWVLQGSNDLQSWVDLRRHINDATIRLPGQYGSWPVVGPAASLPYRAFRVLLSGPTLSVTDPWNVCLSSLELYGYFYRDEGAGSDANGGGGGAGRDARVGVGDAAAQAAFGSAVDGAGSNRCGAGAASSVAQGVGHAAGAGGVADVTPAGMSVGA